MSWRDKPVSGKGSLPGVSELGVADGNGMNSLINKCPTYRRQIRVECQEWAAFHRLARLGRPAQPTVP